jgi:hypothetical protein
MNYQPHLDCNFHGFPQPFQPLVARADIGRIHKAVIYLWTLPTSALALPLIVINAITGGSTHLHEGVVEIHGRSVRRFLSSRAFRAAALTLGHVVLNVDDTARLLYRSHEFVHVRQAEKWGPLFVPLYLGLMVRTWRKTGRGYWNHPWEVEAREISGI